MKKTLVLAIVSLFAFVQAANAQFYVGGSLHISSQFQEDRNVYVGISPDLGYALGDWCVGSIFDLNIMDGRTAFTANPYVEYYFWRSGALSFFVEGGVGLTWNEGFSFNPYIAPGICFAISDHWSVLGHIGRFGYDSRDKSLQFSLSKAASLGLGLYYSF